MVDTELEAPSYARVSYDRQGTGRLWPILLVLLALLTLACFCPAFISEEDETAYAAWFGWAEDTGRAVDAPLTGEEAAQIVRDRSQSDEALVSAMFDGESALGFDAKGRTFYCSVGLENGDAWPALSLSAKGAADVRVAWLDDYAQDSCAQGIRQGRRYELLAYTQDAYERIGIVFTGLPIVSLNVQDGAQIAGEDVSAEIHIAGAGYEALHSMALVHERGGGYRRDGMKASLHVELRTRAASGHERKNMASVLGMDADSDWLLLSCEQDSLIVRNSFSWALWRDWNDGEGVAMLDSRFVEVFVDGEYAGIYQLLQRVDAQRELLAMGGNPHTDVVGRHIREKNAGKRPRIYNSEGLPYYEMRYIPAGMSFRAARGVMQDYLTLVRQPYALDAQAFAELVSSRVDIPEALSYYVYMQVLALGEDNTINNLYTWALRDQDGYHYILSPWDMDKALVPENVVNEAGEDSICMTMYWINRMLDLNVGGCRALLWDIWREKRATLLEESAYAQRFDELQAMIDGCGAFSRNEVRWNGEEANFDLSGLKAYALSHLDTVEREFARLWPVDDGADTET